MRRMVLDTDAVSPLISTIIIITMMLTVNTMIILWGTPTIYNYHSQNEYHLASAYFESVHGDIRALLSDGVGAARTTTMHIPSGEFYLESDREYWITSYNRYQDRDVLFHSFSDRQFTIDNAYEGEYVTLSRTRGGTADWWTDGTSSWAYRVPVAIGASAHPHADTAQTISIDCARLIREAGRGDTDDFIDPNSFRLVEYTNDREPMGEVPVAVRGIEFAADRRGDAWDMSEPTDLLAVSGATDPSQPPNELGILESTTSGAEPWYELPRGSDTIDTTDYYRFTIRMNADEYQPDGGELFWHTTDGTEVHSDPFPVYAGWHTYSFDLRDIETDTASWEGEVDGFQLRPIAGAGHTVRFDWAYLCGDRADLSWIIDGTLPEGATRGYYLYFDTLDNGPKQYWEQRTARLIDAPNFANNYIVLEDELSPHPYVWYDDNKLDSIEPDPTVEYHIMSGKKAFKGTTDDYNFTYTFPYVVDDAADGIQKLDVWWYFGSYGDDIVLEFRTDQGGWGHRVGFDTDATWDSPNAGPFDRTFLGEPTNRWVHHKLDLINDCRLGYGYEILEMRFRVNGEVYLDHLLFDRADQPAVERGEVQHREARSYSYLDLVIEDDLNIPGISWTAPPNTLSGNEPHIGGKHAFQCDGDHRFDLSDPRPIGDSGDEIRTVDYWLYLADDDADIAVRIGTDMGNFVWGYDVGSSYDGAYPASVGTSPNQPRAKWVHHRIDLVDDLGLTPGGANLTAVSFMGETDALFDHVSLRYAERSIAIEHLTDSERAPVTEIEGMALASDPLLDEIVHAEVWNTGEKHPVAEFWFATVDALVEEIATSESSYRFSSANGALTVRTPQSEVLQLPLFYADADSIILYYIDYEAEGPTAVGSGTYKMRLMNRHMSQHRAFGVYNVRWQFSGASAEALYHALGAKYGAAQYGAADNPRDYAGFKPSGDGEDQYRYGVEYQVGADDVHFAESYATDLQIVYTTVSIDIRDT